MTAAEGWMRCYCESMSKEPKEDIESGTEQAADGGPGDIPEEALGTVTGGWPPDGGNINFTLN